MKVLGHNRVAGCVGLRAKGWGNWLGWKVGGRLVRLRMVRMENLVGKVRLVGLGWIAARFGGKMGLRLVSFVRLKKDFFIRHVLARILHMHVNIFLFPSKDILQAFLWGSVSFFTCAVKILTCNRFNRFNRLPIFSYIQKQSRGRVFHMLYVARLLH